MSTITQRYDRDAQDYEIYWAPVLDATARRLLDRVEPWITDRGNGTTLLDIGTGTGVLALEALRRWPELRVIGVDASAGMLSVARGRADRAGRPSTDPQLRWLRAEADAMPLEPNSVDVVVSSFVFQLVPDRAAALGQVKRVLKPGGWLALVTWLDRGPDFEPSVEFDEAVYDIEIDEGEAPEDEEIRAGDFRSRTAAERELRKAGFGRVSARDEVLEYGWTLDSYLAFKEHYDERALFSQLDADTADRLVRRARERMEALPDDAFTWRADVVSAVAQKPTENGRVRGRLGARFRRRTPE